MPIPGMLVLTHFGGVNSRNTIDKDYLNTEV